MIATTPTVTARNVEETLPAGTVFTLTEDLTRVCKTFARRPVGAHFVSAGLSDSGWCVVYLNTFTGKPDQMMAEDWCLKYVRIIGTIPARADECGSCGVTLFPGTTGNVAACDFHDQTCDRCDSDLVHAYGRSA